MYQEFSERKRSLSTEDKEEDNKKVKITNDDFGEREERELRELEEGVKVEVKEEYGEGVKVEVKEEYGEGVKVQVKHVKKEEKGNNQIGSGLTGSGSGLTGSGSGLTWQFVRTKKSNKPHIRCPFCITNANPITAKFLPNYLKKRHPDHLNDQRMCPGCGEYIDCTQVMEHYTCQPSYNLPRKMVVFDEETKKLKKVKPDVYKQKMKNF